ncbi:MAG: hypothetical protein P4L10_07905 [Acidobacteriaceae bacterium]|nr:hypothetical protein [Acidobacteriaceae bacterium]
MNAKTSLFSVLIISLVFTIGFNWLIESAETSAAQHQAEADAVQARLYASLTVAQR